MSTNIINISNILKRSSAVNSVQESVASIVEIDRLYNNLVSEKPSNSNLFTYIESMKNITNANNYYYKTLDLLESVSNNKIVSEKIFNEYTNSIIPYMNKDTLNSLIRYTDSYNIDEKYKKAIEETANLYTAIDRVIDNNNKLSKKYNIESCLVNNEKSVYETCLKYVDNYNIKNYQKYSIALEETVYLLEKNGTKYDRVNLVESFTKYALLKYPELKLSEVKKVLEEGYILTDDNTEEVVNKFDYYNFSDNITIDKAIFRFSSEDIKPDSLSILSNTINSCSKEDIVRNFDKVILFIKNILVSNIINYDICIQFINNIIQNVLEKAYSCKLYSKSDITDLIYIIDKSSELFKGEANDNVNRFANELNNIISDLENCKNTLYSETNLEAMNIVDCCNESVSALLYKGYGLVNKAKKAGSNINAKLHDTFKFHNLITASYNLDKYLAKKEKALCNKVSSKINKATRKLNNVLFGESFDYNNYIVENQVCIPVAQYLYNIEDESAMIEFADNCCEEYNYSLDSKNIDNIRVYYENVGNVITFFIKDNTILEDTINSTNADELDIYIEQFTKLENSMSLLEGKYLYSIDELISDMSIYNNFTTEHFALALEAMQYLNIDNNTITLFREKFLDKNSYNYRGFDELNNIKLIENAIENYYNNKIENSDINIQLEAYSLLLSIFEDAYQSPLPNNGIILEALADDWDDDDDEEDDDDDDKKEEKKDKKEEKKEDDKKSSDDNKSSDSNKGKKSFVEKLAKGLNSIRIGLEGIKYKAKELGAKEEEMSRNLDSSARAFAKAIKNCFTVDRREAIIKGSVIPSFSRCIKNGIILAGMGLATQTLVVPCVALVGGLAISKKLNKKERLLLLDEIETELEVVEKEINIAESNSNMKKYRALLQYKKELQRQYQRIKYNIRIGKDIITSDTGVPKVNN